MIYFTQDSGDFSIKIGFTDKPEPDGRIRTLQTGNPSRLVALFTMPGTKADEDKLHDRFASARIHGEWFRPTPELLSFILAMKGATCREAGMIEGSAFAREEVSEAALKCQFLANDGFWGEIAPDQLGPSCELTCPVCGCQNNHLGEWVPINWTGRGRATALIVHGECHHTWRLCFGFHKGTAYVWAIPSNDLAPWGDPIPNSIAKGT